MENDFSGFTTKEVADALLKVGRTASITAKQFADAMAEIDWEEINKVIGPMLDAELARRATWRYKIKKFIYRDILLLPGPY